MKELVSYIVKSIVEFPDQVVITERNDEEGKILELRVAESDLGKVIGKKGRTAKSIRSILGAAAGRKGEKAGLDIVETVNK